MTKKTKSINRIGVIGDTQIKPGVNYDHLIAYGQYLNDKRPQTIVMLGDWWDMPSLSSYEKPGSDGWEMLDVEADIDAGNQAMSEFLATIKYKPEMTFLIGNHEDRLDRARRDPYNRRFRKYLGYDRLNLNRWKVIPFLKIWKKHGISFSHYFTHGPMDRPMSSQIQTQIKNVGTSFVAGHNQQYQSGQHYTSTGKRRRGVICGSFYTHNESYLSAQGNARCWRGTVFLNDCRNGDFDLVELSCSYLTENWL